MPDLSYLSHLTQVRNFSLLVQGQVKRSAKEMIQEVFEDNFEKFFMFFFFKKMYVVGICLNCLTEAIRTCTVKICFSVCSSVHNHI